MVATDLRSNDITVALAVEKGARSRSVVLPRGEWKAEDGTIHKGGSSVKIEVPLQRLPYFVKCDICGSISQEPAAGVFD